MKPFWIKLVAALPFADTAILIQNGKAKLTRGKARAALLSELTELSEIHHVEIACITASTTSAGRKLTFYGIPEELHQRFRNVWGVHWQ